MTTTIVIILVIIGLIALAAFIIGSHMVNKKTADVAEETTDETTDTEVLLSKPSTFKLVKEIPYERSNWEHFEKIIEEYSEVLPGINTIHAVKVVDEARFILYLEDPDNETFINEIISYLLSYEHLMPKVSSIEFVIKHRTVGPDSIGLLGTTDKEIKTLNYKRGK